MREYSKTQNVTKLKKKCKVDKTKQTKNGTKLKTQNKKK